MKTRNRLAVTGEEWEEGQEGKGGKGTSQRTCKNDLWTQTTGWGLTVGMGLG